MMSYRVRQKFRIRWKHDRIGPDPVLYGYDGYTDSCTTPSEGGFGPSVPQAPSSGGSSPS